MKPMSDLIELSDHFRRTAQFENNAEVMWLLTAALRFAKECTWIDLTYPVENKVTQANIKRLTEAVDNMAQAASLSGLNRIILPLHTDHPFAQFIQREVLDKNTFCVDMEFRESDYTKDLRSVGLIDQSVQTILDVGIRGLCAIDSETKYKWDAEVKGLSLT